MRIVLALLLALEALSSGLRVLGLLPALSIYPWTTLVVVAARMAVAMLQFTSASMLFGRKPAATAFARGAFVLSALLVTLEVGWGLVPSQIFPTYRWPLVAAYWLYTLACLRMLDRLDGRQSPTRG